MSGIFLWPDQATALLVLGHGAGAGMTHQFMEDLAVALARRDIATLRYNFPFKEEGNKRPDREAVLIDTVSSAVRTAKASARGLPVFVGGKSMGGRMTSRAVAAGKIDARGIVFFGFPLHAAGKPNIRRAAHLTRIERPMLFLQGTRDRLADLDMMGHTVADLGELAELQIIEGADHSFSLLKSAGRSNEQALEELASHCSGWIAAKIA